MKIIFFSLACFICAVVYVEAKGTPMHEEHSFDGHKFVMKIRGKRSVPIELAESKVPLTKEENHNAVPEAIRPVRQIRHKRNPSKFNSRPVNKVSEVYLQNRMRRSAPRAVHKAHLE